MDLHRAEKFIDALHRIGYEADIRPDNIDQMFQNWSTSIVLENLTEWILHDCPNQEDLQIYEMIKDRGYHELPENTEDNTALLEDIAKQESLIGFYAQELKGMEDEIEALECEVDSIEGVHQDKTKWNCFKRLQKCINSVDPFIDNSCDPQKVHEIFTNMAESLAKLIHDVNGILRFIEADLAPEVTILPGSMFETIEESKLLLQGQSHPSAARFKQIVASFGDENLLNGQKWIEWNRDQIHGRVKMMACRVMVEALALVQIFRMSLDEFEERFNENELVVQRLISDIEKLRDILRVDIPKLANGRESGRVSGSHETTLNPFPRRLLEELNEIEGLIEYNIRAGTLIPENITDHLRHLDELIAVTSAEIKDVTSNPPKLTRSQLDIKSLFSQLDNHID